MRLPTGKNKYGNKKTYAYGRWFDSKAEADYYTIAVAYASKYGYELRLQEKLEILSSLKINQWTIKKVQYIADYAFYNRGQLIRLVDVKGVETPVFKLKAKMIAEKYGVVIDLAKRTRNGFSVYPFNMPKKERKKQHV